MSVRRSMVVADESLVEHLTDVSFGSWAALRCGAPNVGSPFNTGHDVRAHSTNAA